MSILQETPQRPLAHVASPLARPLPRLTPLPPTSQPSSSSASSPNLKTFEVVVIGAGPAGLLLTLLLTRLGLPPSSLATYDAKPAGVQAGHADGLQPRTLEVLQSLGLVDEVLRDGCWLSEVAFWNPRDGDGDGIARTAFVPDVSVRCRFRHEVTMQQGRIERILGEDLARYGGEGVQRGARFVGFVVDGDGDAEFPVTVEIERVGRDGAVAARERVRTKYLVGADGAHSAVRGAMGLRLEGETTDHVWGVCDFVAETDFPDVRKRSAIHSRAGSVMVIPRERAATGEYLTRLYVQIKEEVAVEGGEKTEQERDAKTRRAAISLEYIFEQARRVLAPYTIKVKEGTEVDWWAAYQIGQRMTPEFSMKDRHGDERVFIVGDACHTHSPKAGQGMNVSMMDSYNLAWKLVHTIHGLSPPRSTSSKTTYSASLLSTYSHERLTIARQLIAFDTEFSSMFSGAIGPSSKSDSVANLTHEQFLKVFSDGNGFTSGCGIEYPEGLLVERSGSDVEYPVHEGGDYLNGCLRPGRRLLDVKVRRFADANERHLQDDFLSTGRYRVLVLASTDIRARDGESAAALNHICHDVIPSYPESTIELVVLHPFEEQRFEWNDVPACIKKYAEMNFHGVGAGDEVYKTYGVAEGTGAVVVVRPDGYVGLVTSLRKVNRIGEYLNRCLVQLDTIVRGKTS